MLIIKHTHTRTHTVKNYLSISTANNVLICLQNTVGCIYLISIVLDDFFTVKTGNVLYIRYLLED